MTKAAAPVLAALASAILLMGCTVSTGAPEGATTGTGENSSFTEAGIERVVDEGTATIDLRGPLTATDLGADEGSPLRDVDESGGDPIEVTIRGEHGDLVVPAGIIRVLVEPGGEDVQSIALFEPVDGELVDRLQEVAEVVGADDAATASFVDAVTASPGDERDVWLNGATDLGPTIGLHPVHAPEGESLIEYQLEPPA